MKLPITSITPFTFQDYPEHTACILWFSGCNMRCLYCHNPELVNGELKRLPYEQVTSFLESRAGLLEGVVLSGGECTLSSALPEFIRYIKSLEYKVKIDTNGTNPDLLERLLQEKLLDFVAMDFKAPEGKFQSITGLDGYEVFHSSLKILCKSNIDTEIRTTVHTNLINEEDVNNMINLLENYNFQGTYVIQKFREGTNLGNITAPDAPFHHSRLNTPSFEVRLRNF